LHSVSESFTPFVEKASRPLRIAILGCRGVPARYGGFETFADHLARGLVNAGMDVTVYAEGDGPDTLYEGVCVRYVKPWPLGAASVIAYDIQCLWLARQSFDVVYMLGYGAAWGCFIPRLWGTRVWVNMDGLEWARSKWHPLVKRYLKSMEWVMSRTANRVLADAVAIKTYYEARYPRGAPCVFIPYGAHGVVPDSVGTRLARHGLVAGQYFLVVARMEPENHILEIIQAHRHWGGPYPLVVVGDHTGDGPFCQRVRACQSPVLRLLGAIYDPMELGALRAGAAAYIHGHSVGGTNPSLLEAMWFGSVVVAHENPFNREVLADSGFYFDSEVTLTNALQQVADMGHPSRAACHQATQAVVRFKYQWSHVIQAYLLLLQSDVERVSP